MNDKNDKIVFWGCFIALITTSFAFFTRMYLCDVRFPTDFAIEKGTVGVLKGAGVWPFAISIILFSLIIDRIGYRIAMLFSFVCYAVYMVMAVLAYNAIQGVEGEALAAAQLKGYHLLYWGSVILGLGNGTVEAFINPVVATMFSKEKTKWLNILHAGWPGGLVVAGIITIAMADVAREGNWLYVLGVIAIPAVVFLVMLINAKFPLSERQQAGVTYREMLSEFGAFGAFVGFGLIFLQLGDIIPWGAWFNIEADSVNMIKYSVVGVLTALVTIGFGAYTQSAGRPLMAFLIIIMMPLATTELGTDGWISGLMVEPMKNAGYNAGWVLIYTSAIMMVLRFFAGPIVHRFSPIGLLIISSVLAIAGLFALSMTGASGLFVIFAAATLYGVGKTFFWPTMLGVTAEQCPKGGALTLNAIAGIGMIAVGVIGFPLIGAIQENTASSVLRQNAPEVAEQVLKDTTQFGIPYQAIDPQQTSLVTTDEGRQALRMAETAGQFNALARIALFPTFMLVCYIIMFFYFQSKGGYKAVELSGVEHPVDGADETIAKPEIGGREA
ncbi:MAG: MFS transporter [Pirellulales bacterium]